MRLRLRRELPGGRIQAMHFDRGGTRFGILYEVQATGEYRLVGYRAVGNLWDQQFEAGLNEPLHDFAFAANGTRIAVHGAGKLTLLSSDTGHVEGHVPTGRGPASELEWREATQVVAAYALDWPPVILYSLYDGKAVGFEPPVHQLSKHMPRLRVSPSGKWLAFCHAFEYVFLIDLASKAIRLWGEEPGRPPAERPWETAHLARRVWLSTDERRLAVASYPRVQSEWDEMAVRVGSVRGTDIQVVRVPTLMNAIDLSPDFSLIAASLRGQAFIVGIWRAEKPDEWIGRLDAGAAARDLRFGPNGRQLAVASEALVQIYDIYDN